MGTPFEDNLTPQQQADFLAADRIVRGLFSTIYQAFKAADWQMLQQLLDDRVRPALALLAPGDELPTLSDLGSAQPINRAWWEAMELFLRTQIKDPMDTNRDKLLKLIGVNV